MNKPTGNTLLLLLALGLLGGCQQEVEKSATDTTTAPAAPTAQTLPVTTPTAAPAATQNLMSGKVEESFDAGGYTYARVTTPEGEQWIAGPTTPLSVGQEVNFSTHFPMRNFHSNALDRDFELLYFIESFSDTPTTLSAASMTNPHDGVVGGNTDTAPVMEPLAKVDGGYTIAEAVAQKGDLAGKSIKVRGKVTKFTGGIMGKNWIHIADGSGPQDLIVTTDASCELGDIIIAEGALSLDRDLGFGYRYEVLMEGAAITVE